MEKLHVLSSGSKANSYVVEADHGSIVIDQGLSCKRFRERCEELGIDTASIKAILVTHEHTDHISGIPLTAHKLGIPVYASPLIIDIIKKKDKYGITVLPLEKEEQNLIGGFKVTPFPIMHDAVDPVGFSIELDNGEIFSLATDTGIVTNHMLKYISRSNHIVLEANHDRGMLFANPKYPWNLKQRIKGNYGHLSNEQTMDLLDRLSSDGLKSVVMAHLSEENNTPELVHEMVNDYRKRKSMTFSPYVATQHRPFSILMK